MNYVFRESGKIRREYPSCVFVFIFPIACKEKLGDVLDMEGERWEGDETCGGGHYTFLRNHSYFLLELVGDECGTWTEIMNFLGPRNFYWEKYTDP